MLRAFDEHVEHFVSDVLDFIAFDLVDEPVEHLFLNGQVTYPNQSNNS